MKDDLVERLRAECIRNNGAMGRIVPVNPDGQEAAARIEALETALRQIVAGGLPISIAKEALTSTREGLTGGEEG